MYCSILAILKAGGTYVPIDPTHPKDCIDYIIEDCDINIIISCSTIWEKMNYKSNSVILDNESDEILECLPKRNKNEDVRVTNEHVAYIIYTFGSTLSLLMKGETLPEWTKWRWYTCRKCNLRIAK
jgi:non-ribosomal peptide synthetase component F